MDEVDAIDRITVRQIAEKAEVAVGMINYHFQSKDNLLSLAIGKTMASMATSFIGPGQYSGLEPVARLKTMLREFYQFAEQHEKLVHFLLTRSLLDGDMQTPLFLVPTLREAFGTQKDEIQLRIIALQLLLPLQVTSLKPSVFHLYSGIDLRNQAQRNRFIDMLVDNLIKT